MKKEGTVKRFDIEMLDSGFVIKITKLVGSYGSTETESLVAKQSSEVITSLMEALSKNAVLEAETQIEAKKLADAVASI